MPSSRPRLRNQAPLIHRVLGIRMLLRALLVVHGTDDEVVGFRHGQRLYARAPGPGRRLWVESATHNDLALVAGERYWAALRAFADGLAPRDTREGG